MTTSTFATKAIATITELRSLRINDFDAKFTTANESLYNILGSVYESARFNHDKADVRKALVAYAMSEHNFTFKEKNPSIFAVMLKIVFADNNIDLRRISSYKRALELIYVDSQENGVISKEQFIKYVKDAGGIEEIRKKSDEEKVTKTIDERVTEALVDTIPCSVTPPKAFLKATEKYASDVAPGTVSAYITITQHGEELMLPMVFSEADDNSVIAKAVKQFFVSVAPEFKKIEMKKLEERAEAAARKEREKHIAAEMKKLNAVPVASQPNSNVELVKTDDGKVRDAKTGNETMLESAPYENCMELLDGKITEMELEAA